MQQRCFSDNFTKENTCKVQKYVTECCVFCVIYLMSTVYMQMAVKLSLRMMSTAYCYYHYCHCYMLAVQSLSTCLYVYCYTSVSQTDSPISDSQTDNTAAQRARSCCFAQATTCV
jgi:hypothetical protein